MDKPVAAPAAGAKEKLKNKLDNLHTIHAIKLSKV